MRDDELTAALRNELLEPVSDIDERRVQALRAAVDAKLQDDTTKRLAEDGTEVPTKLEDRRRRFVPVLAVAAAILLVAGGAIVLQSTEAGDPADLEYAGPIDGPAGTGELRIVKTGIGRVVDLDTQALDILPTGEFYELWFVATNDTLDTPNRISAGTFHPDPDGRSRVTFAAAVDPTKFPTIEITAEPADGDPAPSGPTVMSAKVSEQ